MLIIICPRIKTEINSPINIVKIKYKYDKSRPFKTNLNEYPYINTYGMIRELDIMGESKEIILCFLKWYVNIAPIKVAILPKIISRIGAPIIKFDNKQPKKRPGIAAIVNIGNTHKHSDKRTWIMPEAKLSVAVASVITIYIVDIIAAVVKFLILFFILFFILEKSFINVYHNGNLFTITTDSIFNSIY